MTTQNAASLADRTMVLERVFDAPPSLVFEAYTNPAHLPHWFGPRGFSCTTKGIDIKPGGYWHFEMIAPDGKVWPNFMRFLEIVENEKIVFDHGAEPDGEPHFRTTITLVADGDKTRLRQESLFPNAEAVAAVKSFGAEQLGHQTLDKLAERLRLMGFTISRTFDAPRGLVYEAWSKPEHLGKWWGPKGMDIEVVSFDFRPGGLFHYRLANAQAEMWGRFEYVAMEAPSKIVYISAFSNAAGEITSAPFPGLEDFPREVYNELTFEEHDGKTTVRLAGGPHHGTAAEWACYRGMEASMQGGFSGTFDQLDAYLAGLR